MTIAASKREQGGRYNGYAQDVHQPDMLPPAVAALLAVTSIPLPARADQKRRSRNGRGVERQHQLAVAALLDEKAVYERGPTSVPNRSPLDILLNASERNGQEDPELSDVDNLEIRPSVTMGKMSFDSVPSLEADDATSTLFNSPPSPRADERSNLYRKGKPLSSPPAESCLLDHPLLCAQTESNTTDDDQAYHASTSQSSSPIYSRPGLSLRHSSFTSNLTASLRVLRSAAKSFSNFATNPAVRADDFLTRSILSISPQFTDERRPLPLEDTPTPALRRYLNPPSSICPRPAKQDAQFFSSHHDLLHHSASSLLHNQDYDKHCCTASIQLQTYHVPDRRRCKPSSSSSASINDNCIPPPSSLSSDEEKTTNTTLVRPREPRENSDFLRVIVLEMNMRREGKLSDTAPGRARFVLPPRKSHALQHDHHHQHSQDREKRSSPAAMMMLSLAGSNGDGNECVPERWVASVVR